MGNPRRTQHKVKVSEERRLKDEYKKEGGKGKKETIKAYTKKKWKRVAKYP